MSFLSPLFLFGALAAAIPIVLHLLRQEADAHVKFSAVKLLRRAPVEAARRQRLREWLLLALRVAALLLLALAFARPLVTSRADAGSAGLTVVALDTSLSMSAPGQFARARQLAREAINRAPEGDAVSVVAFADTARITAAPGAERALALAAVDSASAGFGATHYRAALNAASEAISSHGSERATIVVVTDLQESGWDAGDRASLPESARVEIADVGAPPPNLSIAGVRVDADGIMGVVRRTGGQAGDARVRITVDGRQAGEATVVVAPDQSVEVPFRGARGLAATVSVDDPEGIQGDNARYVVLNNAGRPPVLVVTANGDLARDAFYVEQALVAEGKDGAEYAVKGVAAAQLSSLPPGDEARLEEQTAVVLLSTRGLERRGRDLLAAYLGNGGGLLTAASDEVDGAVLAELLGGPSVLSLQAVVGQERNGGGRTLAPSDARHPVFRVFGAAGASLGLVTFSRFMSIGGTGCQTLAKFTTGEIALADCTPGEGRALVFASDLGNRWNDFPLHTTFVPFLHEAIDYLSGARPRRGEYLVGEVPEGVPSTPGIASVPDAAARAARSVAVNVDPTEADVRRLSAGGFQAAVTRLKDVSRSEEPLQGERQEDRQRIWRYVLALMAATLVVETLVARK